MNSETTKMYREFNAEGVNQILSDAEKETINKIAAQLNTLDERIEKSNEAKQKLLETPTITKTSTRGETFTRKLLAVDVDYLTDQKVRIFSHGRTNYVIWFLNKKKLLCCIDSCNLYKNDLFVTVTIDVKGYNKRTKMSLDRFLYLVEIGDFTITNKKFNDFYMKPYIESELVKTRIKAVDELIEETKQEIEKIENSEVYKKYNALFEETKKSITKDYIDSIKNETRETPQDKAKQLKKKAENLDKKKAEIKTIWNSTITEGQKADLMGWVCRNIKNIKIKVVENGVSDKVISSAYPDEIYGTKYKEKPNSSGWDASSGVITFKSIDYAPIETIKKLSTIKHIHHTKDNGETIFKGKSISNLDFALFLLSEYNKYGFKSGINHLYENINVNDLVKDKFKGYLQDFENSYDPERFPF